MTVAASLAVFSQSIDSSALTRGKAATQECAARPPSLRIEAMQQVFSAASPQYAPRGKGCGSEYDNRFTSGKEGAHAEATHAPNLVQTQLHGHSPCPVTCHGLPQI